MATLADYLTVKEAAEFLGVSKNTVRNWAASGKLQSFRHPINNYRLFDRDDLSRILDEIRRPARHAK